MNFIQQSGVYQKQAEDGYTNAKQKLISQGSLLWSPYYNSLADRQSIAYPFAHIAQCTGNVVSIVYGAYLLCKSIVTCQSPIQVLTMVACTIGQCVNLLLNICNVLLSLVSLGSRALKTAVNGKYVFEAQCTADDRESGPINRSLNEFVMANEGLQRTDEQQEAERLEEENNRLTHSFI